MPKAYLEKYFGKDKVSRSTPNAAARTQKFLARQFGVSPEEIELKDGGVYLSGRAYRKMLQSPADDDSFLATGGSQRIAYEMLEMGYNDVMSGAVTATGHTFSEGVDLARKTIVGLGGEPAKEALKTLADSGALAALSGAGVGVAAGVGLWLARLGVQQVTQADARDDGEQFWHGARSLFLGTESLAAAMALASTMGSSTLFRVMGQAAKAVAIPFATIHGVIDVGQGAKHVAEGVKQRDYLHLLEGVSEIGMGVGWLAAAFAPTPMVVATSCLFLGAKLAVTVAKHRRSKEEIHHERHHAARESKAAASARPEPSKSVAACASSPSPPNATPSEESIREVPEGTSPPALPIAAPELPAPRS